MAEWSSGRAPVAQGIERRFPKPNAFSTEILAAIEYKDQSPSSELKCGIPIDAVEFLPMPLVSDSHGMGTGPEMTLAAQVQCLEP